MSDPFDLDTLESQAAAPVQAPTPYLDGLNDEQKAAVLAIDGPVLVLAGAGTGKTRALTTRLAHILGTGRAWPGQILAVTFTNKAASEMRNRVGNLVGQAVEGMPWLGTFHSVCARILRRHAEMVGLRSNFTILDTDDQIRLIKQLIQAEGIDEKRWPARLFAGVVDQWKNKGLTPDKVPADDAYLFADGKAIILYKAYQDRLRTLNAADFGDLLLLCLSLFMENDDVLADYQRRFKYILVDEYQDTNVAQYLWLRLLAQKHHNICCVGDDDQSIYGWRGAEVGNILKFEEDFPGGQIIRLERNYRSTSHILGAASGLISANTGRLGKTLWTDSNGGDKVHVTGVWDGEEEARNIGDSIEGLKREGSSFNEVAVLVRAGFQTREFEDRFMTIGVPYRVIGGLKFYERREVRDALAYLRVIHQSDDDLAFERIFNMPKRGLGDVALKAVHEVSRSQLISLTRAARQVSESDDLRPRARNSLKGLMDDFDRWRTIMTDMPHTELAEIVLDESGYTEMLQRDKAADAPGRLDNLQELVRGMEPFENLAGFLEHVSLATAVDELSEDDKVNVMTLHSAKGLEFDNVFLPGWEEGLFPHQRALDEGGNSALEEERRLAYVGLTRARRRAFVSAAANRRIYNQWQASLPSRFIEELPLDHVEREAAPGLSLGGYQQQSHDDSDSYQMDWDQSTPPRQTARYRRPPASTIQGKAEKVSFSTKSTTDYAIGERVFHQKFGYGVVEDIDGNKLEISFDKAGTKRVLDSFVDPADKAG
jgi:DNA helicase-2/ATP-dependent DNA helicase PcrA